MLNTISPNVMDHGNSLHNPSRTQSLNLKAVGQVMFNYIVSAISISRFYISTNLPTYSFDVRVKLEIRQQTIFFMPIEITSST